ncbi:methyltransferase domain-containing protein [Neisseriaceae bacterium JH1-16]|nr:methyltransferase domain-containing protein [Neisseriaceae bacterium JH1-16]
MRHLAIRLRHFTPWLFVQELLTKPAAVGAIWPSSDRLARCMAAHVPTGYGLVVELGGGTGAVTQALLERGLAPERLLVIECSPTFVRHLRQRFPGVTVLHGDATELANLLPNSVPIDAIVSSLPLRSLPADDTATILAQWCRVLPVGGIAIQFTYDLRGMHRRPLHGFVERASDIVWANLPPARVQAFEFRRLEHPIDAA